MIRTVGFMPWVASRKRLIVTATTPGWHECMQVKLRPEQVRELMAFLSETVELKAFGSVEPILLVTCSLLR